MKINTQDITKADYSSLALRLHSMFYTIQGEGPFVGRPALFVRLQGCNLRCYWCDTEYSEGNELYNSKTLANEILVTLNTCPENTIVVLTGGEPMAQNISPLLRELANTKNNITVQIESNGTACPPDFPWENKNVHLVLSPKTGKVHRDIKQHKVLAWKYVLGADQKRGNADGLPYESTQKQGYQMELARPMLGYPNHKIYVSPLDEGNDYPNKLNRDCVLETALKYGYTISLQTHKILNVE